MIQAELINGALPDEKIVDLIKTHKVSTYQNNMRYYRGENPTITDRLLPNVNAPNYKLPVSYARKIVRTVVGYMYKPGLITYNVEDNGYKQLLDDIFLLNNENTKTSAMGRQSSIQGVGFELHYTAGGATPYFAKIPVESMIVVYDYAIEPELIAAIRYYRRKEDQREVEVYYADRVDYFSMPDKGKSLVPKGSEIHQYDQVPVVVFENNEEWLGDFEPIKPLIDAYDVLMSDSMNEFDRFAWAYLILKNMTASDQDANDVKYKKIIELFENGDAYFLQKEIPSEYIKFMAEWIREEIHKQSHVPDFTDTTLGTEMTGAAIDRLFYDFEFIAADKEDRFRDALKKRIGLVNTIIRKGSLGGGAVDANDVEIIMGRNKPQMLRELGETAQFYSGLVSEKTLIEQFAPFTDPETEEERKGSEGDPYRSIDGNTGFSEEQPEDNAGSGQDN